MHYKTVNCYIKSAIILQILKSTLLANAKEGPLRLLCTPGLLFDDSINLSLFDVSF